MITVWVGGFSQPGQAGDVGVDREDFLERGRGEQLEELGGVSPVDIHREPAGPVLQCE